MRADCDFNEKFVVGVTRSYNGFLEKSFRKELELKGFKEYSFLMIMQAGERDLERIITNEHIAGKEWGEIKTIVTEIASALEHMHSKNVRIRILFIITSRF